MKLGRKHLVRLVVALLVVGALIWAFLPQPMTVDVERVTRGPLQVTIEEDGRTRIRERHVVSAPLAGTLLRVQLKAGDKVEAGRTLVAAIAPSEPELLDPRTRSQAQARVKAAEAAVRQAETALARASLAHEFAANELTRTEGLFEESMVSVQEMERAVERERLAGEEARAANLGVQIAEHELELALAVLRLSPERNAEGEGRFEIHAPISGRVLRVFQESATPVWPGTNLVELGDARDLEIAVDVLSSDAVRIPPGARMLIEHWGGEHPLLARVRLVEPAAFTKISALGVEEQRVWVIADFVDAPELWRALGDGYRVEARIVIREAEDVLKVATGALFRRENGWAVFVAENGRARFRPVGVGMRGDLEAEVLDGLAEGDEVIVYPGDRVQDGARIVPRLDL